VGVRRSIIRVLDHALPARVKKSLVNLGFNLDLPQFQRLATKYLFAPHMEFGLQSLAERGFNPSTILDVGAFEGNWAEMALRVWPRANIIMVEAHPEKAEFIRRKLPRAELIQCLLGSEEGKQVTFHLMEAGSSVFQEHSPVERRSVQIEQRGLDVVMANRPQPELIKVDVQGYEIEVLKGGLQTLSGAQAVILELSLIEINEGAPLLHEALIFMKSQGFVAYDIFEIHRRPLDGAMNQVDFVFLPEISPLRSDRRHWS